MTILSKFSLRQIKQRIAIQHRLSGLQTLSEVEHYIRQRLQVAGYNGPEIFTKEALEAIFRYSSGSPRLVNMICDNSLALVCEAGDRNVSATMATKAASGFQLEREVKTPELVAAELAVVPMARLDQKAEANQTRLEMDDRVEPAAVSLQSSDPVVIPPTVKAKSPPVSPTVSDNATNGATKTSQPRDRFPSMIKSLLLTNRGIRGLEKKILQSYSNWLGKEMRVVPKNELDFGGRLPGSFQA